MCYRIPDDNSYRKPNLTTERQGFCRKAHGEKTGIDPHVSQRRGPVYKDILFAWLCITRVAQPPRVSYTWKHLRDSCSRKPWRHPGGSISSLGPVFSHINLSADYNWTYLAKRTQRASGSLQEEAIYLPAQPSGWAHTNHCRLFRGHEQVQDPRPKPPMLQAKARISH